MWRRRTRKKFGGGGGELSISAIQPVSISAFLTAEAQRFYAFFRVFVAAATAA
jgi:hypothetical protein